MAVPSTFADLSTTPASNGGLVSDATAVNTIDDHLRAVYALIASVYANSGNGWASPYLTGVNPSYTGTLTGGTGVVNIGSGQIYKDSSGNVGFGTTTGPASGLGLSIYGSTGVARLTLRNTTTGDTTSDGSSVFVSGLDLGIENREAGAMIFYTNGSARARIDSAGNVGIGTAAPDAKLHVIGSVRLDAAITSSATAGGAIELPVQPAGYLTVNIGGTNQKIPYYAE